MCKGQCEIRNLKGVPPVFPVPPVVIPVVGLNVLEVVS